VATGADTLFFLIFVTTVFITRVFVFIRPVPAPTIFAVRLHHYMFGLVGILLAFIFNSLVIYAVGFGLFVDELTFLLMRGKNHEDNYSKVSLWGTVGFVILVFILKHYLILPFV
jgi:hypothetical protein